MKLFKSYLPILFGFLCLAIAWHLETTYTKPQLKISKQESALNFNDQFLKILSTGQSRLISSSLWISTLLESDLEHVSKELNSSWMFLRFNTISKLDPYFLKNYQFGGQYLSIIKDDLEGSKILLKRGISFFPKDYILNFNLGYLFAIELDDYNEAAIYLEEASKSSKAPGNIKTLMAKVKFMANGNLKETYEFLLNLLETSTNKLVKDKLTSDLYSLKAEIDLKCLNFNGSNCDRLDFEMNSYIFEGGKYFAPKPFKKYKLHKRKKSL